MGVGVLSRKPPRSTSDSPAYGWRLWAPPPAAARGRPCARARPAARCSPRAPRRQRGRGSPTAGGSSASLGSKEKKKRQNWGGRGFLRQRHLLPSCKQGQTPHSLNELNKAQTKTSTIHERPIKQHNTPLFFAGAHPFVSSLQRGHKETIAARAPAITKTPYDSVSYVSPKIWNVY